MIRCSPRSLLVAGLAGLLAFSLGGLLACVDLTPYPMVETGEPEAADAGACDDAAADLADAAAEASLSASCVEAGP